MNRIELNTPAIDVPPNAQVGFMVRLSETPKEKAKVRIRRTGGEADISLVSRDELKFDRSNFDRWQMVTLESGEGGGADTAVFTLSGEKLAPATFTAAEPGGTAAPPPPETASNRIVIDPVTRIEGHLRIEVEITDGVVRRAWTTGTLFRGIETILRGRDPRDAPLITQRLCGVCTYIHGLCSVQAIEDAAACQLPGAARTTRNLMLGAQYLHDHIVHFYHLHGMDWIDLPSALDADPGSAADLARQISPSADPVDFGAVQATLAGFVNSGQLGPFANAYWGHPAYALRPEANLLLAAHYLEALRQQARTAALHAVFGGKNPHPQHIVAGGVTCAGELGDPASFDDFESLLTETRRFVDTVYLPDVKYLAGVYPEWAEIGGFDNLMAFGEFPLGPNPPDDLFLPRGLITARNAGTVRPVNEAAIAEYVGRSWYQGSARHPAEGETQPNYTGLNTDGRYSWCKAPRYEGAPMEVGPLARMMVAYGNGHGAVRGLVDGLLSDLGMDLNRMFSTVGRTAARAIETKVIGDAMVGWLAELRNAASGRETLIAPADTGISSTGVGMSEAPRGALGHWLEVSNGQIGNYQMVVPSTWNFSPRCDADRPGPLEQALEGMAVADPSRPVEVLRVVHSYDPCLACAVHVTDTERRERFRVRVI
jgi:[NiFe] hydrogenase large subunit